MIYIFRFLDLISIKMPQSESVDNQITQIANLFDPHKTLTLGFSAARIFLKPSWEKNGDRMSNPDRRIVESRYRCTPSQAMTPPHPSNPFGNL